MRNKRFLRTAAICGAIFLAGIGVACSNDPKAAPTKSEVTLDPNLYTVEHADLFKLATVEARDLPTTLNANGTVTPDVNSTIHVTSQGSGRVVELKVRLGEYVKKGQELLSIHVRQNSARLKECCHWCRRGTDTHPRARQPFESFPLSCSAQAQHTYDTIFPA